MRFRSSKRVLCLINGILELWAERICANILAKKRFCANHLAARESISPNTQVTFTDERATSFLMLSKLQSSRLEQIHEGNFFGGQPSNMNDAPAYPRLM